MISEKDLYLPTLCMCTAIKILNIQFEHCHSCTNRCTVVGVGWQLINTLLETDNRHCAEFQLVVY